MLPEISKKYYSKTFNILTLAAATASLERLAYFGMSSNLLLYFKLELNQHSATASRNLSNWTGACYIAPLFGAFVADGYIGKYWTIACSSVLYAIVSQHTCYFQGQTMQLVQISMLLHFLHT